MDKKVGLVLVLIALAIGTLFAVVNGTQSQDCETLYNEWSNTVDMTQRDALFSKGIDNGCFHYN